MTLASLMNGLKQSANQPHFEQVAHLISQLDRIQQMTAPPPRPAPSPPIPLPQGLRVQGSEEEESDVEFDASDDDAINEDERQQIVDQETDESFQHFDAQICRTYSRRLEIFDWVINQLSNRSNAWRSAFEEQWAPLFQIIPALAEMLAIQQSGSFAAYQQTPFAAGSRLTEMEYLTICNTPFIRLADELEKQLSNQEMDPALASLEIKLRLACQRERRQNERMILIALMSVRRAELARLSNQNYSTLSVSQLQEVTRSALNAECIQAVRLILHHRMNDISKAELQTLFRWLSSRGRTDLLREILDRRGADILLETYFDSICDANLWGHEGAYQLLYQRYPHNKPGMAKTLLIGLSRRGVAKGVRFLLSSDYPRGFQAATIDQAFKAACDAGQYLIMSIMLDEGVRPSNENLTAGFEVVCLASACDSLFAFCRPDVFPYISGGKATLNALFESICQKGKFSLIDAFLQPEVLALLDDDQGLILLDNLLLCDLNSGEERAILGKIMPTALFDKLSDASIRALAVDAAKQGKVDFVLALVHSRRGNAFDRDALQEILIAAMHCERWDAAQQLLQAPRFGEIGGARLGAVLEAASQKAPSEVIEVILSKESHIDPIPALTIQLAFKSVCQRGEVGAVRRFLERNPMPALSSFDVNGLIHSALSANQTEIAFLLLRIPSACALTPNSLGLMLMSAAREGRDAVFSYPFLNMHLVTDGDFIAAIYEALDAGSVRNAIKLYMMRQNLNPAPEPLYQRALHAVFKNDSQAIQFLYQAFPRAMEPFSERLYRAAEALNQASLSVYFWNRVWMRAVLQPQPV